MADKLRGCQGLLEISNDNGTTYERIGLVTSYSFNQTNQTTDTTTWDDNCRESITPTITSRTASLEGLYAYAGNGSVGIDILNDAVDAKSLHKFRFTFLKDDDLTTIPSGTPQEEYDAYVISFERSHPNNESVTFSSELQIEGAIAETTT